MMFAETSRSATHITASPDSQEKNPQRSIETPGNPAITMDDDDIYTFEDHL